MPYYSGQGKLYVATVVNGAMTTGMRFVGNVPALSISLETDIVEHKESTSGQRLTDLRVTRGNSASASLTLEDISAKNLALALYGADSTIASGSVTNEVLSPASGVVAGDFLRLAGQDVSSVVIKDSAGSPATLTAGTHYRVNSAKHGSIEMLNVTGFTQPFKADYSRAQVTNINMLTAARPEQWWHFEGLNTADGNKAVLIDLYKVSPRPMQNLALISDEVQQFVCEAGVLYDGTKVADTVLGQFGRVALMA